MKRRIVSIIVALILLGNTYISFADDLIFTRNIVERNGGVVGWDNGKIDIKGLDKEVSIWIDKNEILIDGIKREMDYKPILFEGQTVLPKRFYKEFLSIEETFKDSVKKVINTMIVTKPEIDWERKSTITEYTYGTPDTTPKEIIERIQEIIFYLEEGSNTEIDISDMKVIIHKGLKRVDDDMLGQVLRGSGRITFWDLEFPDYLNYVVIHEIGHYIEGKFLTKEDFKEYMELRGLEEEIFNGDSWERTPSEVFAEDFVNIFVPSNTNKTDAEMMNKEEIEIFKEFLFRKIYEGGKSYE